MLDADDLLLAVPSAVARDDSAPLLPPPAKTVRDTGLDLQLLVELVAKTLYTAGKMHLPLLHARLRLPVGVLREVLDFLQAEHIAELSWRGETELDVQYQLTAVGKQRAAEYLERSRYLGPAPVTLAAYREVLRRQSARHPRSVRLTAPELAAAFADEVLDPAVRDQVGAALYAGRALLLHGPSGAGKTTLARKLARLQQGVIAVPYALAVDGQIIELHDPAVHCAPSPLQARQADERRGVDARWVVCQRPLVAVGAELDLDAFELRYDAAAGVYHAPPQLAANGGVLLLDDLGRQRGALRDLLHRITAALDTGSDRLLAQGNHKIAVPFDMMVMLATDRLDLLDAAQLRRIGYQVRLGALAEDQYRLLFRQQCRAARVVFDEAPLAHLIGQLHRAAGVPLLPAWPRALIGRLVDFAGYAGHAPRLTVAALEQAWVSLFAAGAGE